MNKRRKSRELALQSLYSFEIGTDEDCFNILNSMAEVNFSATEVVQFARKLITQVLDTKEDIDELLQKHASNWDIKRMAVLDRNILRLAVAEFNFPEETPFRVVINEAVELAKRYGNNDSGKFVNGILDTVYKEMQ